MIIIFFRSEGSHGVRFTGFFKSPFAYVSIAVVRILHANIKARGKGKGQMKEVTTELYRMTCTFQELLLYLATNSSQSDSNELRAQLLSV